MQPIIEIDDVHKQYLLGNFGYGTLRHDIQSWFSRALGKDDPNAKLDGRALGENEEFWALRGVSFKVYPGDTVGIVGRNGSGKSTLFKILSRLTAPTKGEVRINGTMTSLLEVGTGFHPDLTGRENIFLNGAILGLRKREIERKLDEIVAFSEVSKFIDTPVKRYSSGMYIRLAFSIAAHLDSEILLLDEVLAVGDESFRVKCLAKMQEIAGSGRTILFVSHSQSQVESICKRAVLLSGGQMLLDGTTKEVFQFYANTLQKKP
jgi:lipopolysaccharide transport system ATP-binding protein